MKRIALFLGSLAFALAIPSLAFAQGGGECPNGLCGTPDQSGGGPGGGGGGGGGGGACGGTILVAMTDRGDTYQFADDFDGDGVEDEFDNCPFATNYAQIDSDNDGAGNTCDTCPTIANPGQADIDGDGIGDLCDDDMDNDNVPNDVDNCVTTVNPAQINTDGDLEGDACDRDDDNDGIEDWDDPCRLGVIGQVEACDDDVDNDGIPGSDDNCATIYNPQLDANGMQLDLDGDGFGDACDLDIDGDGIANFGDNCTDVYNPGQLDEDRDGLGDAGNWSGGDASCDPRECYVIGGDQINCLDPSQSFTIYLNLVGNRVGDMFQVGEDITVAMFTNRIGQLHNWTARFSSMPSDSDASMINARGSASTLSGTPQVANCMEMDGASCSQLNTVRFMPDAPGRYEIKITANLPKGDPMGVDHASYTIVADVEGEALGGCAAVPGSGLAILALALLASRRRK